MYLKLSRPNYFYISLLFAWPNRIFKNYVQTKKPKIVLKIVKSYLSTILVAKHLIFTIMSRNNSKLNLLIETEKKNILYSMFNDLI